MPKKAVMSSSIYHYYGDFLYIIIIWRVHRKTRYIHFGQFEI